MKLNNRHMLLYAVTDRAWLGEQTLAYQVEQALLGGATFIQLREKELSHAEFLKEAKEIKDLCQKYKVPFVINDNVEVALACDADGVHVGQEDMGVEKARAKLGEDKIIGVSTHTVEQAQEGEAQGADYLGVGAAFSTSTKPEAGVVSKEMMKAICDAVKIPVVAIGGIDEDNILELSGTGIDGVALVSALFAQPDIKKAAEKMRALSEKMTTGMGAGQEKSLKASTASMGLKLQDMEGAIFDMDGTLLDSMHIWDTIGEDYLKHIGKTPRSELREALRPMSLLQAAEYFRQEYGVAGTVQEIMDEINELIRHSYFEIVALKPGVRPVLDAMKKKGVKMCVATATDRHLAEASLKRTGIADYFCGLFTCGEAGAGKDQPKVFLQALNCLGTKMEKTYVFEDAYFAAQTAKKAGFPLVAVYDKTAEAQQEGLKEIADIYLMSFEDMDI